MRLDPDPLSCPEHPGRDLTDLVREELLADPEVVSNLSPRFRRRTGPSPFLVIVTCPGEDTGGAGGSHLQSVEGAWTP